MAAAFKVTATMIAGAQKKRAAALPSTRNGCCHGEEPAGGSGNWR